MKNSQQNQGLNENGEGLNIVNIIANQGQGYKNRKRKLLPKINTKLIKGGSKSELNGIDLEDVNSQEDPILTNHHNVTQNIAPLVISKKLSKRPSQPSTPTKSKASTNSAPTFSNLSRVTNSLSQTHINIPPISTISPEEEVIYSTTGSPFSSTASHSSMDNYSMDTTISSIQTNNFSNQHHASTNDITYKSSSRSISSMGRYSSRDPTPMEQSQYYVNMLLTDTERNMHQRKKLFENELTSNVLPALNVNNIEKLNLEMTEIPEKDKVTKSVDSVLNSIHVLMNISLNLKEERGVLTSKFRSTILNLERKILELQVLMSEKDLTLKQVLQREENTVNALETALENAIAHERDLIQKYNLPADEFRLIAIAKNTNNLSAVVKERWKDHHDLEALSNSLKQEAKDNAIQSEKFQEELQHALQREHEKHIAELNRTIESFQSEYSGLLTEYKQLQARLSFYENDKQYMKQFRGPSGRVTIVFTDVEGSTTMWEQCEEAMTESIKIHNRVIRSLLEEFNGYEVKTEGDAFMCAFSNCIEALDFSLQVQLCLLECGWPADLLKLDLCKEIKDEDGTLLWRGLRVRFGIHVGYPIVSQDPTSHRDDYFGPVVNKAARVEGYADGGGICISSSVWREIESHIKNMRSKLWVTFLGKKPLKGMDDDELRLIVPAQLRSRKFSDADKQERWKSELSWKPLHERQKDLEKKIHLMKHDISQALKVNSLQSISDEKDVIIQFLLSQSNSNINSEELSNIMSQFSKSINHRLEELTLEATATAEDLAVKSELPQNKPEKKTVKFSSNLLSVPEERPDSSKSTEGRREKKKKKRRSSYLKPVEIKSYTIEVSKDEFNMMQHNLKFLKEQRDQAVKKQRNLAMALLESQTKLHHVARDVERFKKQIKAGGSFGIAAPAIDFKDLEKPKKIKIDSFYDDRGASKKKKIKNKRSRSVSPSKKLKRGLSSNHIDEHFDTDSFNPSLDFEITIEGEDELSDSGQSIFTNDSSSSQQGMHYYSTEADNSLYIKSFGNDINDEITEFPLLIPESVEYNEAIKVEPDEPSLDPSQSVVKRSRFKEVKPRFLDHFTQNQREYEKAKERLKQNQERRQKHRTTMPTVSAKVTSIDLSVGL